MPSSPCDRLPAPKFLPLAYFQPPKFWFLFFSLLGSLRSVCPSPSSFGLRPTESATIISITGFFSSTFPSSFISTHSYQHVRLPVLVWHCGMLCSLFVNCRGEVSMSRSCQHSVRLTPSVPRVNSDSISPLTSHQLLVVVSH